MTDRAERRKQARKQVRQARQKSEKQVEEMQGNPAVQEAVKALQEEITAVEQFLNIEVQE